MAAKNCWHTYETKLRHCQPINWNFCVFLFLQLLLISQLSNRFLQQSFTSAFIESPLSVVLLQHAFERRFYQSPTLLSVIVRDSFRHATSRCWSDRSSNKHKTVVNTRLRRRSGHVEMSPNRPNECCCCVADYRQTSFHPQQVEEHYVFQFPTLPAENCPPEICATSLMKFAHAIPAIIGHATATSSCELPS